MYFFVRITNNVIFIKHSNEDINVTLMLLCFSKIKSFSKKKSINKILFINKDNRPTPYCQADKGVPLILFG